MAYDGLHLLYIDNGNGFVGFPNKFIKFNDYKITPQTRLDLDSSLSTADGKLHRTVLPHRRSKVEFNTPDGLTDLDFEVCVSYFPNNDERKCTLKYFDFSTGDYSTGEFYMPDWTASIHMIKNGRMIMNACRFAFIEY